MSGDFSDTGSGCSINGPAAQIIQFGRSLGIRGSMVDKSSKRTLSQVLIIEL